MPLLSIANLNTLVNNGLAAARVRFPGKRSDNVSFLGTFARMLGMGLFGLQRTAESVDRESPPNPKTSDNGVIVWAEISGVPSNQGGYGRNGATPSKGGQAPVTGTNGTTVLAGQQLVAADGTTIIQLDANVTIPATGSFSAVTPGSVGNLPVNTVLTWLTPPTGCDPTVTLTSALTGGGDIETIAHLLQRIEQRWQAPPKGGANIDYKEWAEAIAGVDTAYVYPLRGGAGTVHIVITSPGVGLARMPSNAVIDAVQAQIDSLKPTDVDEALVMAPTMPSYNYLTFGARAFLAINYSWDWVDTASTLTVVAYDPVAKTLQASGALPVSLTSAIDNGELPLIQVLNTAAGAPSIPQQIPAVAYNSGTNTITLQSAFGFAPSVGNEIHAGSYAMPFAAQKILDYVNALGPSRVSGFADSVETWDDVASVWGAGNSALSAIDTDGTTRMLTRLAGTNGLTISVGGNTPTANDFEPPDNYTLPPELAYAAFAFVVQAAAS